MFQIIVHKMYRLVKSLGLCMVALSWRASVAASGVELAAAREQMQVYSPALVALYDRSRDVLPALQQYVLQQGFNEAHEQLGVLVHELIHIESARRGAFWIDGQGYEGYQPTSWPPLAGRDLPLSDVEKAQLGLIYENYLLRNPETTLRNVVDELNAYSQTAGFICRHFAGGADKQARPLLGHLALANAFLAAYTPGERGETCGDGPTEGVLALIVKNSYKALSACGVYAIPSQGAIRSCLE